MSTHIKDLHAATLDRIAAAAKRASRLPADICLTAVSKQQPDNRIADMLATGQTIFGENKVQEAQARWQDRFADARTNIQLRMIGPLQTNKAGAACALFDVIETLDREKLAKALVKALNKDMYKTGRSPELFVQVNTGEEPQKSGILPGDLDAFIKTLRQTYDLHPSGLMCIPPAGTLISGQAPGPHFALLAKLAARNGIKNLSMGMSSDFETAIELGATHIRVGSALFGARN